MGEDTGSGDNGGRGEPSSSYTGEPGASYPLAEHLSKLARSLEDEQDVRGTLDSVVHTVVAMVPGAQHASLSSIEGRQKVVTRAATNELPRAVDHAQYDSGQGPCLDTLYDQQTVRLPDLETEQRWPEFTKRATELGVAAMLSVQLFVWGSDLGALNLFSSTAGAFSDESEDVALLFASHAAVAMANAEQRENLRAAIDSRDLIGQAKGILMERFRLTSAQAFTLLTQTSQDANRKVRDIADELVHSGALPRRRLQR